MNTTINAIFLVCLAQCLLITGTIIYLSYKFIWFGIEVVPVERMHWAWGILVFSYSVTLIVLIMGVVLIDTKK